MSDSKPVRTGPVDHGFTAWQQGEYDSLHWKGRSYYDQLRWYHGFAHDEAFSLAMATHGPKVKVG